MCFFEAQLEVSEEVDNFRTKCSHAALIVPRNDTSVNIHDNETHSTVPSQQTQDRMTSNQQGNRPRMEDSVCRQHCIATKMHSPQEFLLHQIIHRTRIRMLIDLPLSMAKENMNRTAKMQNYNSSCFVFFFSSSVAVSPMASLTLFKISSSLGISPSSP